MCLSQCDFGFNVAVKVFNGDGPIRLTTVVISHIPLISFDIGYRVLGLLEWTVRKCVTNV